MPKKYYLFSEKKRHHNKILISNLHKETLVEETSYQKVTYFKSTFTQESLTKMLQSYFNLSFLGY